MAEPGFVAVAARRRLDVVWSCLVRTHEHATEADARGCVARHEAADDLYAACEETRRWLEEDTYIDMSELSEDALGVLAVVRAALAKADGEGVTRG